MNIDFRFAIGDIIETTRGDTGKVSAVSAFENKRGATTNRTYRIELDGGAQSWVDEHHIKRRLGWA